MNKNNQEVVALDFIKRKNHEFHQSQRKKDKNRHFEKNRKRLLQLQTSSVKTSLILEISEIFDNFIAILSEKYIDFDKLSFCLFTLSAKIKGSNTSTLCNWLSFAHKNQTPEIIFKHLNILTDIDRLFCEDYLDICETLVRFNYYQRELILTSEVYLNLMTFLTHSEVSISTKALDILSHFVSDSDEFAFLLQNQNFIKNEIEPLIEKAENEMKNKH